MRYTKGIQRQKENRSRETEGWSLCQVKYTCVLELQGEGMHVIKLPVAGKVAVSHSLFHYWRRPMIYGSRQQMMEIRVRRVAAG